MGLRILLTNRCFRCLVGMMLLSGVSAFASLALHAERVEGFVTKIGSPTEFYIGTLDVRIDARTQCITESVDANIQVDYQAHGWLWAIPPYYKLQNRPESNSKMSVSCSKSPWVIGSHVEVLGDSKEPNQGFDARQITIYSVKISQRFADAATYWNAKGSDWEGAALLEEQPQIKKVDNGYEGTVWLDGYPVTVTPDTELITAPAGTEVGYRLFGFYRDNPRWEAIMPKAPRPAFSTSLFKPNSWSTYSAADLLDEKLGHGSVGDEEIVHSAGEGKFPIEGLVWLQRIRLWPNHLSDKERKYIAQFTPAVHPPDYEHRIPGNVGFDSRSAGKSLKILPNRAVQEFVSDLGWSLVPEYQRRLTEKDPTKIEFRFYVVQGMKPRLRDEMSKADAMTLTWHKNLARGVAALPDGMILIPDYMLVEIGSEAQLATLLSCAITSVVQKQGFVTRQSGLSADKDAGSLAMGSDVPMTPAGLIFYLFRNEQALRIGIRQMYLAGYDIREAPFAWAAAAGKTAANPLPGTDNIASEIPWYTAYAFDYISRFYSWVDFSKLKRGEREYTQFLDELRKTDPEAFERSK